MENSKKCKECGTLQNQESNFCIKCGAKLDKATDIRKFCTSCGRELSDGTVFCEDCGTKCENVTEGTCKNSEEKQNKILRIGALTVLIAVIGVVGFIMLKSVSTEDIMSKEENSAQEEQESDNTEGAEPKSVLEQVYESVEDVNGESIEGTEEDSVKLEGTEENSEQTVEISEQYDVVTADAIEFITESSYLVEHFDSTGIIMHNAELTLDSDISTAWSEAADSDGIGEWIQYTFDEAYIINGIEIYGGYGKGETQYYKNNRPKDVKLYFSDGTVIEYTMDDTYGIMDNIIFGEGIVSEYIKIELVSVYQGNTYEDTCISEIILY